MLGVVPVSIATSKGPVELSVVLATEQQWKCTPHPFAHAMNAAVTLLETMDQCRSSSLAVYAKEGLPSTGGTVGDRRVTFEVWRRDREGRTRLLDDHELAGDSLQLPVALSLFLKALQLLHNLVDGEHTIVPAFDPGIVATGALKNGDVHSVEDIPAKLAALHTWLAAQESMDGPVPFLLPQQAAKDVAGVRCVPIGTLREALEFLLLAWLEANEGRIRMAVQPLVKNPNPLRKGPRHWVCEQWATYGPRGYARFVIDPARDRLASEWKIRLEEEHAGRVLLAALDWSSDEIGGRIDACLWRLAALRYVRQASEARPAPRAGAQRPPPQSKPGGAVPPEVPTEVMEDVLRGDPSRSELPGLLRYLEQGPARSERELLAALRALDRRLDESAPKDRTRVLVLAQRFASSASGPVMGAAVSILERLPVDGSKRWDALRGALRATAAPGRAQLLVALIRQASTQAQQAELRKLGRSALKRHPTASVQRAATAALERLTRNGPGSRTV